MWMVSWLPDELVPGEGRWVVHDEDGRIALDHNGSYPHGPSGKPISKTTAESLAQGINAGDVRVRRISEPGRV